MGDRRAASLKSVVITGGTDGIGRALADEHLNRGNAVLVVGQNQAKGEAFLATARAQGAQERAHFVPADLSLVSENERVLGVIGRTFPVVDLLVLCARYHRAVRTETAEGLESNFALFYLSRFLLGHGLAPALAQAETPIVLNVAGPGSFAEIPWDDLQLRRHYVGTGALGLGGRLNDLLGAGFAVAHPGSPVRYVLVHPGVTATSFAGEYDSAGTAAIAGLKAMGKSVSQAVHEILPTLDDPPAEPLSAFSEGVRLSVRNRAFDPAQAARLQAVTEALLAC
jgi:NAD(P)-dependent dehydrogenase (short-subunit alcohol dehydrogenase family)